jgi:hypothetical protein
MLYQRKTLSTNADVGEPDLLPVFLRGLSDAALADLTSRGFPDVGYFPVPPPEPEPPPPDRWIHKALFKRRFTAAERIAIRLTETNEEVPLEVRLVMADFREVLDSTEKIHLDDPDVIAGLDLLVTLGLLTSERPAEIRL